MLEQHLDDRPRNNDQGDGGGQRQQKRELKAAVLARHRAGFVVLGQMPRQCGQQYHADGDAHHAERELVDPVGVVKEGNRARLQRGDGGADEQVHLIDAAGDDAGHGESEQPARVRREARPAKAQVHACLARGMGHVSELCEARDSDAPGLDDAGFRLSVEAGGGGEERYHDQNEIEEDGRGRRRAEFAERV